MGIFGMTAGTIFLMWLGEQIDEYGIGNGISLIIMAGIVSRVPWAVKTLFENVDLRVGAPTGYNRSDEVAVFGGGICICCSRCDT